MRLVDIVVEWDLDREGGAVVGIGGRGSAFASNFGIWRRVALCVR